VESSQGLGKGFLCVVLDKEEVDEAVFLNGVWALPSTHGEDSATFWSIDCRRQPWFSHKQHPWKFQGYFCLRSA
jgi:hypothetical protein